MGMGFEEWLPPGLPRRGRTPEPAGDTREWSAPEPAAATPSAGPAPRRPAAADPGGRAARRPRPRAAAAGVDLDRATYEELRAFGLSVADAVRFLALRERSPGLDPAAAALGGVSAAGAEALRRAGGDRRADAARPPAGVAAGAPSGARLGG